MISNHGTTENKHEPDHSPFPAPYTLHHQLSPTPKRHIFYKVISIYIDLLGLKAWPQLSRDPGPHHPLHHATQHFLKHLHLLFE